MPGRERQQIRPRTPDVDEVHLTPSEFDDVVLAAIESIPVGLRRTMDNVVIAVEAEPPPEEPDLLGFYDGTPLTERGDDWARGSMPDRITIFQGPLQRMSHDVEELRHEIAVTVVHEVAHHFGIDDDRLHTLGWS